MWPPWYIIEGMTDICLRDTSSLLYDEKQHQNTKNLCFVKEVIILILVSLSHATFDTFSLIWIPLGLVGHTNVKSDPHQM